MKKVLILAYDFPPYVSVGGLRPYNWYKYFKEYGVEPIVVTRQWANNHGNELDYIAPSSEKTSIVEHTSYGTVIRTPYRPNLANRIMLRYGHDKWNLVRRSISAFFEFSQFFLPIGPKRNLYLSAREYLKKQRVDCIIATGDPFILFKYANDLSREFQIPWIADYRDPWTTNKTNFISRYFKPWNWFFERSIVRRATIITTVDNVFKRMIGDLVKNKDVHVLPNGYDPESIEQVSSIEQKNDFLRIAFVGTIYPWHPIEQVFLAVERHHKQHPEKRVQLNFFGINVPKELTELLEQKYPAIASHVLISPRITNNLLMKNLAKNNVMLLFNYYAYTGTKIYDYLAIRRKILLCFTEDPDADKLKEQFYNIQASRSDNQCIQKNLIEETRSGLIVKNVDHLTTLLEELIDELEVNGRIACDSINIERYSRKIQVEKLAEVIKEIPFCAGQE